MEKSAEPKRRFRAGTAVAVVTGMSEKLKHTATSAVAGWNRFWYAPGDPLVLAVMPPERERLAVHAPVQLRTDVEPVVGVVGRIVHEIAQQRPEMAPFQAADFEPVAGACRIAGWLRTC